MDSEIITYSPISLLYPDPDSSSPDMTSSFAAAQDLGFIDWFDMKNCAISDFLTCDPEVIGYRCETVKDILEVPEVLDVLKKCVPIMADVASLRRLGSGADSADEYIYSITEVELYVSLVELLRCDLLPLRERLSSRAMKSLCDRASLLSESDHYKEINRELSELAYRVREIKSVTLGVNLDERLSPESAGLLSVNHETFRTSNALGRILKIDSKQSENTFIAPLVKAAKAFGDSEREGLGDAVLSSLGTVFKTSFKSWKRIVKTYVLENTDFLLSILPEIEFLSKAGQFLTALRERGVELTFPKVSESGKTLRATGLINPRIALMTDGELVPNDVEFDGSAGIYVITGPNRGGKSVFTCAVGQAVIMASLGLPVCASSFEMSSCDNVYCHFPAREDDSVEKGRLGEECARLEEIISKVTDRSLVLLDESLSSTGSYEAAEIAGEVLAGLSALGVRAIFSTHLHSLASRVGEINDRTAPLGGVKIDTLAADITDGVRSFKVVRRAPEGKSHASDVAEKYGLSFENILKKGMRNDQ